MLHTLGLVGDYLCPYFHVQILDSYDFSVLYAPERVPVARLWGGVGSKVHLPTSCVYCPGPEYDRTLRQAQSGPLRGTRRSLKIIVPVIKQ